MSNYKVPTCRVCGEPIYDRRGTPVYCRHHRPRAGRDTEVGLRLALGRDPTRVECWLANHGHWDLAVMP